MAARGRRSGSAFWRCDLVNIVIVVAAYSPYHASTLKLSLKRLSGGRALESDEPGRSVTYMAAFWKSGGSRLAMRNGDAFGPWGNVLMAFGAGLALTLTVPWRPARFN